MDETLTSEEQRQLLNIAREALSHYLATKLFPPLSHLPERLMSPGGCFVTLHRGGMLRGCIGRFQDVTAKDDWPLAKVVQLMAIEAALGDPRFPSVTIEELSKIEIELSVLSPPHSIAGPEEVVVGRHGLIVSHADQRGVLLPQVAVERHWDRDTFLAQTCCKAGLPADAWRRSDIMLEVFTAEVFSEHDPLDPSRRDR